MATNKKAVMLYLRISIYDLLQEYKKKNYFNSDSEAIRHIVEKEVTKERDKEEMRRVLEIEAKYNSGKE